MNPLLKKCWIKRSSNRLFKKTQRDFGLAFLSIKKALCKQSARNKTSFSLFLSWLLKEMSSHFVSQTKLVRVLLLYDFGLGPKSVIARALRLTQVNLRQQTVGVALGSGLDDIVAGSVGLLHDAYLFEIKVDVHDN